MRKIVLFIAMSLDGYIADSRGGVDWLNGQDCDSEHIDAYSEFVKNIDTILMGWNTYYQVTTELSPTEWIYSDFTTYVITHNEISSTEQIRFINENPIDVVEKLKSKDGKNIWICGGANLVQQLMHNDLIDQYYISVIPTLLGSGIRLFGNLENEIKLKLLKTQTYNGITDLVYIRREKGKIMDRVESNNYNWKLIAEDNGNKVAEYQCSNEIVGDLIEIIATFQTGETVCPNETMVQRLKELIEKGVVTENVIIQLTGLDKVYVKHMLSGKIESAETRKLITLSKIIEKLRN